MVIPTGFGPGKASQRDELLALIYEQKLREEEDSYIETPEEADDFFIEDDYETPFSAYELQEMHEEAFLYPEDPPVEESVQDASQAEREPAEAAPAESPTVEQPNQD